MKNRKKEYEEKKKKGEKVPEDLWTDYQGSNELKKAVAEEPKEEK